MSVPEDATTGRGDPPPYAWLDDPAQPFGPVSIGTTVVIGLGLVGVGLFAVGLGLLGAPDVRAARVGSGLPLSVIGTVIVRMGVARRAWRRRNPGVDPLAAAHEAGANVGSAFGNDSWSARLGRWVLVLLSALVAVASTVALRNELAGPGTSILQLVIIAALGLLAVWTGWKALSRSRSVRRRL
ncbi:hypothetical protein [Intrasporangium sp.]|uniref:hypothetical protein n=1 Tax=Intrasporangium sp. TaxID=1925024 RepID=UPI002939D15E|nr:hypothetical protein [Intrasporangium sp.]MDV3220331.1 hypothetical protein [Intrasporangium sp.]